MINFLLAVGIGIFLGWVAVPQPSWAQKVWNKIVEAVSKVTAKK